MYIVFLYIITIYICPHISFVILFHNSTQNNCRGERVCSIAPPENPSNAHHVLQTTGEAYGSQKRYLLRHWGFEPSRIDAVQRVRLRRVRVGHVAGGLLDDWRLLTYGLRRACDGRLGGQTHVVVQRLIQLLVGVGPALRVRILVVGGVPAVGAVHGILTARCRQVGEAVVMEV